MAAGRAIDSIFVQLGIDAKGFRSGMKEADGILQGGLKNIMSKFVAPLTAALGGAKLFHDYTSVADNIGKLSASLGISGSELHAWGEAAARAGGSVQGLQSSVRTLQRQLSVAGAGGGQAGKNFERLGISLTDANGKAKDAFEVMRDLAGVAEGMDKAKFAGLAGSLRLDQGTIQMLQGGRRELDALIERQKRLGVYTEEDFKAAGDFNNAWADLRQSFGSVAAIVMRTLLPPLTNVLNKTTEFATFLRKNKTFVETFFKVAAAAISMSLLPSVEKLRKTIKESFSLVDGVLKFKGLNSSVLKWASLAAAIAGVAMLIEDFVGYMNGKKSAFESFWKAFGTPEEVKASVGKFMETAKGIGETLKSWLPTITKITVVMLPIFGVSKGLLAVYNGFKAIRTIGLILLPVLKSLFVAMMSNPLGWIAAAIAGLAAIVIYWDDIKAVAAACMNWISDKWHAFVDGLFDLIPDWLKNFFSGNGSATPQEADYNNWLTNYASAGMTWEDYQKQFAVAAVPGGTGGNIVNSDTDVKVGSINISVPGGDAEEIAENVNGALREKVHPGYDSHQTQRGDNPK